MESLTGDRGRTPPPRHSLLVNRAGSPGPVVWVGLVGLVVALVLELPVGPVVLVGRLGRGRLRPREGPNGWSGGSQRHRPGPPWREKPWWVRR